MSGTGPWCDALATKHYGFWCWLRRHRRRPDYQAFARAGVVIDWCEDCSRKPANSQPQQEDGE